MTAPPLYTIVTATRADQLDRLEFRGSIDVRLARMTLTAVDDVHRRLERDGKLWTPSLVVVDVRVTAFVPAEPT